jgi:hypothetical protein
MISNTNKSSCYHNMAIRGPKGWNFEDFSNTKTWKILNTGGFRLSDTRLSAFPIIGANFRPPEIINWELYFCTFEVNRSSVVRLRVHFEFGHFSNWGFYSEHCKHIMGLIRNDISWRKNYQNHFPTKFVQIRQKRSGVMGSSVQNFVNLGSDKKLPQTVAKEMSDYVQSLSRLIRCTFLKILRPSRAF